MFIDNETIYPVPNAWDAKGATYFDLDIFKDALKTAYWLAPPKKLAGKYLE